MGDADEGSFVFAGVELTMIVDANGVPTEVQESQETYLEFLEEVDVPKERTFMPLAKADARELHLFRSGLGALL